MTTKEEVMILAAEAGVPFFEPSDGKPILILSGGNYTKEIITLIELAKAQEREACADVCETISAYYEKSERCKWPESKTDAEYGANHCAEAIRNRERSKE